MESTRSQRNLTVRRRGSLLLLAALIFLLFARLDGFTLWEWWRDCHSGVVRWQADTLPAYGNAKEVALTFDDGPDPRYTPQILTILRRYHLHATFFVEGRFVRAYPALAEQIVAQGHVLGNHTETHPYLNRQEADAVRREIGGCDQTLQQTLGLHTFLFRPPRGLWNPTIYRAVVARHDHLILWTVALEHHEVPTPRQMADRALRLLQPGGILLMHDGGSAPRDSTVAALPLLLEGLQAQGYRCLTVPELLKIRGNEKTTRVNTRTR